MKRGDLFRVHKPGGGDPKKYRIFVVVSRPLLIHTQFSTVVCAPIYSQYHGISTQIPVGVDEGLKHESSIHCDELMSLPKTTLTHFIGTLSENKTQQLDTALRIALSLD